MAENFIKVYGRLKPASNPSQAVMYKVYRQPEYIYLELESERLDEKIKKYRYDGIFTSTDTQTKVFETVAIPIINSVLKGYNGTIFAYGQTGSGKTYTITGSSENFDERGLIPRTIEYVFQETIHDPDVLHSISVSFMEIYNDIGYDLLSYRTSNNTFQLPKISVLEDSKGEIHMKNLSVIPVANARDAMHLLFLGDTNKTIAETPMNMCSSRSHCIFTVYLTTTFAKSATVHRAKLHLVDLAGSEAVQHSAIAGVHRTDAIKINLSLFYLQKVIASLAESSIHVPYRNSLVTTILKGSLGGNCLTSMLATLSTEKAHILETISTCRFVENVAMVGSRVFVNEHVDPQNLVESLRAEVQSLKEELRLLKCPRNQPLTDPEITECKEVIKRFLREPQESHAPLLEPKKMQMCLMVLKRIIMTNVPNMFNVMDGNNTMNPADIETSPEKSQKIQIIKNHRIPMLSEAIEIKEENSSINKNSNTSDLSQFRKELSALQLYLQNFAQLRQLEHFSITLKQKYKLANKASQKAQAAKLAIIKYKKNEVEKRKAASLSKILFCQELESKQAIYRIEIKKLQDLQVDIEFIKHQFNQERIRILTKFTNWFLETYKEPITAMSVNKINEAIMQFLTGSTYCSSSEEDDAETMEDEKTNSGENMLPSTRSSENFCHTLTLNARSESAKNMLDSVSQSTGQKKTGNAPIPLYDNHLNLPLEELDNLKKLHDMMFKQQRIGVRDITQVTSTNKAPYNALLPGNKTDTQCSTTIAYIDLDGELSSLSKSQPNTNQNSLNKNKESIAGENNSAITNQIQNVSNIPSYLPGQVNVPYSNYNYNYIPVNNNYRPPNFGCPESISNTKISFPSPHLGPTASYYNKRKKAMVNQEQNFTFVQPTIAEHPFRNHGHSARDLPATPLRYFSYTPQDRIMETGLVTNLPSYNPPAMPPPVTSQEIKQVYGSSMEITQQNNAVDSTRNFVANPSNHPQKITGFLNTNQQNTTPEALDLSQIANIPLTGDKEVDEEILKFYQSRFNLN